MPGLADTIARLTAAACRASVPAARSTVLQPLEAFGSNPGALRGFTYVPAYLRPGAPLVVVLHGCTQDAATYDHASGWSQLADEQGFALLYPEQVPANNPNRCFNWFEARDTRRDAGEALSIRQMIAAIVRTRSIDPARIFITGLSAGGAMSATMLALYPEVFAAGAIIAGLPHGAASGMAQAFERMRGHGLPAEAGLQSALAAASDHSGPWPRISIWHGGADTTVSPANADAQLAQWRGVHRLSPEPTREERIGAVRHRSWYAENGQVLIEDYRIAGIGHGTPLNTHEDGGYGAAAPFMLDVGISSTACIARFWGIAPLEAAQPGETPAADDPGVDLPALPEPRRLYGRRVGSPSIGSSSAVGKVIEDALRAAGLMK